MDAISFVLGVQSAKLRSHNLSELVHRTEGEEEVLQKKKCYVKLVYDSEDGQKTEFLRGLSKDYTSSEYK